MKMRNSGRRGLTLVVLLLLVQLVQAQVSIRGRVVNDADGQPVPFCSVFLANTTKGTTADEHGQFILTNLPAGRFDLVVSSVGFETLASTLTTAQSTRLLIRLQPAANQLAEVNVKASRGPEWQQNMSVFLKNFVGTSQNAAQCQIVNNNVMWFDDDPVHHRLTAGAREPLLIENRALGYRIKYALDQFTYDYGKNYTSFLGYPVYEPMQPKNRRQALRWEKARKAAYLGSILHFMRAIHQRKANAEGFEIRRLLERTDSVVVWGRQEVRKARYLLKEKLPDTFLINDEASSDSLTVLSFENMLEITYTNARYPIEYVRANALSSSVAAGGHQLSVMYLTQPSVTVESNGNYYQPLDLIFEGYWGWEKMADLLPLTYEP